MGASQGTPWDKLDHARSQSKIPSQPLPFFLCIHVYELSPCEDFYFACWDELVHSRRFSARVGTSPGTLCGRLVRSGRSPAHMGASPGTVLV